MSGAGERTVGIEIEGITIEGIVKGSNALDETVTMTEPMRGFATPIWVGGFVPPPPHLQPRDARIREALRSQLVAMTTLYRHRRQIVEKMRWFALMSEFFAANHPDGPALSEIEERKLVRKFQNGELDSRGHQRGLAKLQRRRATYLADLDAAFARVFHGVPYLVRLDLLRRIAESAEGRDGRRQPEVSG